jgi:hypothetical protein
MIMGTLLNYFRSMPKAAAGEKKSKSPAPQADDKTADTAPEKVAAEKKTRGRPKTGGIFFLCSKKENFVFKYVFSIIL